MAPIAKLRAISDGVRMAVSLDCERLLVESEYVCAINLILKKSKYWGEVEAVLGSIWTLIPSFIEIYFSFIPKTCNFVADSIAKRARVMKFSDTWVFSILS